MADRKVISKKPSWRHHYLPRFYLKGFTNEQNKFLIYLIKEGCFKENGQWFSPKSQFFETKGNTMLSALGETDFLEEHYKESDDAMSKVFQKIRKGTDNKYDLAEVDIPMLQLFAATPFWRLPVNESFVQSLLKTKPLSELVISVKNRETNEKVVGSKFEEKLKNRPDFYKFLRLHLPFITFPQILECDKPVTIISFPDGLPALLSDNPLILRNPKAFDIYRDDFIL